MTPFDGVTSIREHSPVAERQRRRAKRQEELNGGVEALKRATFELCNTEYVERWGEDFLGGASSIGGSLIRRVEGLHGRAKAEHSARTCYDRLRKKSGLIQAEVLAWLAENEYLTGYIAAAALAALAHPSRSTMRGSDLPAFSEIQERFLLFGPPPGDGFSETTWLLFEELSRPPIREQASNREVAVILILMQEAPAGWAGYDRRLKQGENVTPSGVIKDVEKRVRDVAGADRAAGAIRTR